MCLRGQTFLWSCFLLAKPETFVFVLKVLDAGGQKRGSCTTCFIWEICLLHWSFCYTLVLSVCMCKITWMFFSHYCVFEGEKCVHFWWLDIWFCIIMAWVVHFYKDKQDFGHGLDSSQYKVSSVKTKCIKSPLHPYFINWKGQHSDFIINSHFYISFNLWHDKK